MSTRPTENQQTAFQRLSGPTERHRALALLIGRWRIEMSTYSQNAPDQPLRSHEIRAEAEWFGDGRYIRENITGQFCGSEHSKLAILGYNNVRRRYEYVTADNYDAAILFYSSLPGQEGDGRQIVLVSDYVYAGDGPEPSGTLVTIRTVIELEDYDHRTLRNYYTAAGRDEYLFLEYIYTRIV